MRDRPIPAREDSPTRIGAKVIWHTEKHEMASPTVTGVAPRAVRYRARLDRLMPSPNIWANTPHVMGRSDLGSTTRDDGDGSAWEAAAEAEEAFNPMAHPSRRHVNMLGWREECRPAATLLLVPGTVSASASAGCGSTNTATATADATDSRRRWLLLAAIVPWKMEMTLLIALIDVSVMPGVFHHSSTAAAALSFLSACCIPTFSPKI